MIEEKSKQGIIKFNLRRTFMKVWATFKKSFLLAILIFLGFLGWSQGVEAQNYPTRPITLLVPSSPGAGLDLGCRAIAQEASKILNQQIIVMNKTGGGGSVAATELVNSKADGYTLVGSASDQLILAPHLGLVTYDFKDFAPIIQLGITPIGIVVLSDSPHKSFKDLIDFARKNPGKVSYGSIQFGTMPHIAMEHVILEEKVNIPIIPYTGSVPAMTALLGGHVSSCGVSISVFWPQLKAGKVRILAITEAKRLEILPDVATLLELGYPYGDVFSSIYLIAAPKGTPTDVVKTLERTFHKAMKTQEFRNTFEILHSYVENPLSGQDLSEYLQGKYQKIGEVIRKANLGKK
jgi:tripartite-type tricarboxylate transporter receptor subunit TctC